MIVDMSSPPPPLPPSQPISDIHTTPLSHLNKSSAALPDFFFTALSLFVLFSSSSSSLSTKSIKFPFISFQFNPRRFLKLPSMSLSRPNPKKPHHNHHFTTPQSLSEWLKPRLPSDSFASWGVKPGTKNVHNLWLELSEGETSLADSNPPIRTVQVVSVRIIDKHNRVLVESHQELTDGTVRIRDRPLSEKMKPNETPESAVYRAVKEELGSIIRSSVGDFDCCEIVRIIPDSYKMKVEERNSVSYPGLPACYVLHSMDVWVDGLPDEEFCTEEVEEYGSSEETKIADKAVSVKKHYWKWVSADSVDS